MTRRSLAVLAALITLLFLVASPASAHTELTSSTPANGAVVNGPPSTISLTFNEPPLAEGLAVQVAALDGPQVEVGKPTLKGSTVTVTWPATANSGEYSISYRVVADDGHPVTGQIAFSITAASSSPSVVTPSPTAASPSTSAPAAPTPTTSPAPSPAPTPTQSGSLVGWVIGGIVVAALAVLVVYALLRRRGTRS
ncbi:MAG: copper resistance protein CopC [Actinobacteria bacterium]|nr:copper resistance protein CopC [Actinomycetota bacterium]